MTTQIHRYYPGLLSKSYEHPEDRRLLQALRSLKGFDQVVKMFMAFGVELRTYAQNLSNNIRVTPRQYPKLYRIYKQAVEALDVHEAELFVQNDRSVNAYTGGARYPYVVVTTGLLEVMDDDEIRWVLAHELGHIKSGHVLYHSLGRFLSEQVVGQLDRIPQWGVLLKAVAQIGLPLALNHWMRASEFTADRAAHLAVGDMTTSVRVMLKLAGGYAGQEKPNVQEFLKQAEDFRQVERSMIGKLALLQNNVLLQNHPYPVIRARELVAWHGDPRHEQIVDGLDERARVATCTPLPRRCHGCGHDNTGQGETCAHCHAALNEQVIISGHAQPSLKGRCPGCGAGDDASDMYCLGCGERLLQTYFSPEKAADGVPGSTSTLSGNLGRAVNEVIGAQEIIIFELEGVSGEGFTCTNERILISKAGMNTGSLRARHVHAFPYGQATEIDHVVGKKHLRIQISMDGYTTPDQDPARVDRQVSQLEGLGNVCHLSVDQKSTFEGFLTLLEGALKSDDPDSALAGLVIDEWTAAFAS